jgi:hypothetical protein
MKEIVKDAIKEDRESIKERSIAISKVSNAAVVELLKRSDVTIVEGTAPTELPTGIDFSVYNWPDAAREDAVTNGVYEPFVHLSAQLSRLVPHFAEFFKCVDTHASRDILNFEDRNIGVIHGGTDAVIIPKGLASMSWTSQLCVLFELKTTNRLRENVFNGNAVVECLSASFLSKQPSVLVVLTDLHSHASLWRSSYDTSTNALIFTEYLEVSLNQMIALVSESLTNPNNTVSNPTFNPTQFPDGTGARSIAMKRKLAAAADISDALAQFEVEAEGTLDWSRNRAVATNNLFKNCGIEPMSKLVHFSMYA